MRRRNPITRDEPIEWIEHAINELVEAKDALNRTVIGPHRLRSLEDRETVHQIAYGLVHSIEQLEKLFRDLEQAER